MPDTGIPCTPSARRRTASPARYLSAYAGENLPRYTSYPPANRFGALDEAAYRDMLAGLPAQASLSLYVHIPFCESLCWYCGCNTSVPNKPQRVTRYLDALETEIARIGALVPPYANVTQIHLGGGSPDYLEPDQLQALMAALRGAFKIAPDAEIAAELDPRGASEDKVAALAAAGLTRASLGVQDFNEEVQKRINRLQPFETVRTAVERLRAAGVASLNLDLMYGLPGQTLADVRHTAALAASLAPDRLAVFGYAHVPWFKIHQRVIDTDLLPQGPVRFAQAEAAAAELAAHGYQRIGFDHFAFPDDRLAVAAREGWLGRNFQGYTADPADALIGLGASSIGGSAIGFAQNNPVAAKYCEAIEAGGLATSRGLVLTGEDRCAGARIERLMCDLELPLEAGDDIAALAPMVADGLARIENGRLLVEEAGRPYLRNLAAAFDPGLERSEGRHSRAV